MVTCGRRSLWTSQVYRVVCSSEAVMWSDGLKRLSLGMWRRMVEAGEKSSLDGGG